MHDVDVATGNGTDDVVHWLVWNLPGTARKLDEGVALEVHQERELDLVLERLGEARIIGINNRDLTTFVTTLDVTLRLAKRIPGNKLIVSESGIFTRDDVKRVAEAGVRAILVGESLMTAKDVGAKIKELLGREEE